MHKKQNDGLWTCFMDMHSGGGLKEDYSYIYIQAPQDEAEVIFYNLFGHSPNRVTCTCCGEDYSIGEHKSFADASGFERGCKSLMPQRDPDTKKYIPLPEDIKTYWEADEEPPAGFEFDERFSIHAEYFPVDAYLKHKDVKVVFAEDIPDSAREGEVPQEGYVWFD